MSEKYIIRYTFGGYISWCYFIGIRNGDTTSYKSQTDGANTIGSLKNVTTLVKNSNPVDIIKMTLEEAEKNIIEIKRIRKQKERKIIKIEIINIETNGIVNPYYKPEVEISRFELMEL